MTPYQYQSYPGYVSKSESQINLDVVLQQFNITGLTPTKLKYGGITRAGLFSYFGFIGTKKVKIYSSFTTEQANLRAAMNQFDFVCQFPKILGQQGNVLIDEWIDGVPLSDLPLTQKLGHAKKVAQFMFELKAVDVSVFGEDQFDYLEYLMLRINHSSDTDVIQTYNHWRSCEIPVPLQLCHNDLFDDNLVFDGSRLYVVDNEMLSVSKGWFLSLRNSFLHTMNFPMVGYCDGVSGELTANAWRLRKLGTTLLGART